MKSNNGNSSTGIIQRVCGALSLCLLFVSLPVHAFSGNGINCGAPTDINGLPYKSPIKACQRTYGGPGNKIKVINVSTRGDALDFYCHITVPQQPGWAGDRVYVHGISFLYCTAPPPAAGDNTPSNSCPISDHPVSFARGEKRYQFTDYQGAELFPLVMQRHYRVDVDPMFQYTSASWYFSYSDAVQIFSTHAVVNDSEGGYQSFTLSSGTGTSVTGNPANSFAASGTDWVYTLANGAQKTFDSSGQLIHITSPEGIGQTITHPSATQIVVTHDVTSEQMTINTDDTAHHAVQDVTVNGQTYEYDWSDVPTTYAQWPTASGSGHTAVSLYDDSRSLLSVTYPDGFIQRFDYNATQNQNNPQLVTGIFETQDSVETQYSSVTYDTYGRVTQSALFDTSASAVTESLAFAYNWDGSSSSSTTPTTTVTNSEGLATVYTFYPNGNASTSLWSTRDWKLASVDGDASASTACLATTTAQHWTIKPSGSHVRKIDAKIDANGNITSFTYDSRNRTTAVITGQSGTLTSYSPTTASQKVETTGFVGDTALPTGKIYYGRSSGSWVDYRSEVFTYDGNNRLDSRLVTDIVNSVTRSWDYTTTYHSGTAVPNTVVLDGPRSDVSDITTYNYNASGQLTSVVLPTVAGVTQTTVYGGYNSLGLPETITDPNLVVTTLDYDGRGRLESSTTAGAATGITYWPNGLTKRITSPDGSWLQYSYNSAHQLTGVVNQASESITLTPSLLNGQWTSAVVKNRSSAVVSQQARVQDALGRIWKQKDAAGSEKSIFSYDANDNLQVIVALGDSGSSTLATYDTPNHVTYREFDGQNRIKCSMDTSPTPPSTCMGSVASTRYTYDDQGNINTVTDANGHVTTYIYNGFGELKLQVSPDTGVTTYEYDAAGNLAIKTKGLAMISGVPTSTADTQVVYYTWDALNRLATINYPDTDRDVDYDYDEETEGFYGIGHLTHVEDASGTTDYLYNALGKVARKTETLGAVEQATNYHYSANGVLEKTIYPSGLEITAASSAAGKVTGLSDTTDTAVALLSNITHQPFGGIKGWQTASPSTAIDRYFRTFDANGWMVGWGIGSASEQAETTLDYDAYGNISAVNSYDEGKSELYEYDGLSRLSQVTANYGRIGYGYDAVGNRTETLYEKQDPATLAWDEFYTEAYDIATGSNRLEGITRKKGTTTLRTRVFDYDERGNIKTDTRQKTGATATVHSLNYGHSDRLDTISAP